MISDDTKRPRLRLGWVLVALLLGAVWGLDRLGATAGPVGAVSLALAWLAAAAAHLALIALFTSTQSEDAHLFLYFNALVLTAAGLALALLSRRLPLGFPPARLAAAQSAFLVPAALLALRRTIARR